MRDCSKARYVLLFACVFCSFSSFTAAVSITISGDKFDSLSEKEEIQDEKRERDREKRWGKEKEEESRLTKTWCDAGKTIFVDQQPFFARGVLYDVTPIGTNVFTSCLPVSSSSSIPSFSRRNAFVLFSSSASPLLFSWLPSPDHDICSPLTLFSDSSFPLPHPSSWLFLHLLTHPIRLRIRCPRLANSTCCLHQRFTSASSNHFVSSFLCSLLTSVLSSHFYALFSCPPFSPFTLFSHFLSSLLFSSPLFYSILFYMLSSLPIPISYT